MAKFFKIKITQGDSVGPYNIYYTTTGNTEYQFSKLYGTNDDASLISYNDLVTGDGVSIEVPNDTDRIVVFNTLQECEVYVTHYVITPTPTPTLTATPTHTPTSTPTQTPTPTITYYYYYLLECNGSHNRVGRSTTPGLSNIVYNPESGLCYEIVGVDNGPDFDFDLDETSTVSDCSDVNCQTTPTPTPTVTTTSTLTPTPTPTVTSTPTTSSQGATFSYLSSSTNLFGNFSTNQTAACNSWLCLNESTCSSNSGTSSYFENYLPEIGDKLYVDNTLTSYYAGNTGYYIKLDTLNLLYVVNGIIVSIDDCPTPTPTPTLTSTTTLTPTPTLTATSSITPTMTNTLMVTSTPTLTTSQTYNMILENQLSNGISITQFAAGFSATWSFSFPLTQGQTGYMTNYGISSGQSMSVHPSGSGFYTVKIYKNEVFLNSFDLFAPNVFVYTFNENILTTDIIRISLVETPTPTPTPTLTATQTPTVTLTSSPLSKSWLITQCGESCNTGICACNNTSTLTVYTLSSVTNLITPGVTVYTNASLTTTWDGYYYNPDSDEVWKFTNGVTSFPNSCAIGVDPCIP